jgi:hypothetical protein
MTPLSKRKVIKFAKQKFNTRFWKKRGPHWYNFTDNSINICIELLFLAMISLQQHNNIIDQLVLPKVRFHNETNVSNNKNICVSKGVGCSAEIVVFVNKKIY